MSFEKGGTGKLGIGAWGILKWSAIGLAVLGAIGGGYLVWDDMNSNGG